MISVFHVSASILLPELISKIATKLSNPTNSGPIQLRPDLKYLNEQIGTSKNYGMAGALSVIIFIVCAALSLVVYYFFAADRSNKKSKKGGK